MTDETHLLVELTSGNGVGELTAPVGHKLVAHLDGALLDDVRTGRWTYLTCEIPDMPNRKVVGTLVATARERLLFLPAYDIEASMDGGTSDLVHHLTLDPRRENGRRTSHIALIHTGAGERGQRGLNHQVGQGEGNLDYWFSLSVPLSAAHVDLPEVLRTPVSLPSRGLQNRIESLVGERIKNINLGLPPAEPDTPTQVLQFDVWTGPDNPVSLTT